MINLKNIKRTLVDNPHRKLLQVSSFGMTYYRRMKKLLNEAFYRAVLGVFFFSIVYYTYNLEVVRSNIGDTAFDTMNKVFALLESPISDKFPKVIMYVIDNQYLKENHLLNGYDDTTYGYIFPRKNIAELIKQFDARVRQLETSEMPKALFVDMSMRYTSIPDNQELSHDDLLLIDILLEERPYPILLAKSKTSNFIENLVEIGNGKYEKRARRIEEQIKAGKLIFVTTNFMTAQDNFTRRYLPYEAFPDHPEKLYFHFAIAGWQLAKHGTLQSEEARQDIFRNFPKEKYSEEAIKKGYNLISSNILHKKLEKESGDNVMISTWKEKETPIFPKLEKWSADLLVDHGNIANTIVLLGVDHNFSSDYMSVNSDITLKTLSGLQLHADSLMTLFFLDGALGRFNIIYSCIIVFLIFFLVDIITNAALTRLSREPKFIITMTIILCAFFLFSAYLLQYQKLWFNWSIPIIFFWAEELIEFIQRYFVKSKVIEESQ